MSINCISDILIPFIIGGLTVTGIKVSAKVFNNPGLAAIIGGLPLGLLTMYFVMNREQSKDYAKSYMLVSATTILATLIYYLIIVNNNKFGELAAWIIAIIVWIIIAVIKYFIMNRISKKKVS